MLPGKGSSKEADGRKGGSWGDSSDLKRGSDLLCAAILRRSSAGWVGAILGVAPGTGLSKLDVGVRGENSLRPPKGAVELSGIEGRVGTLAIPLPAGSAVMGGTGRSDCSRSGAEAADGITVRTPPPSIRDGIGRSGIGLGVSDAGGTVVGADAPGGGADSLGNWGA